MSILKAILGIPRRPAAKSTPPCFVAADQACERAEAVAKAPPADDNPLDVRRTYEMVDEANKAARGYRGGADEGTFPPVSTGPTEDLQEPFPPRPEDMPPPD